MAGVRRHAVKGKRSKRKIWKKGESSSCNPDTKTYRTVARSRFFQIDLGLNSKLTTDALDRHNAEQNLIEDSGSVLPLGGDDASSVGNKTFDTFASNWTLCTNPSFETLLRKWKPGSAASKDWLALLAAVMEVIKSNGGKESDTEYFAALMTVLKGAECDELVSSAALLLSVVMRRLPSSVLQVKFVDTSELFLEILSQHVTSERPSLLKGLLSCLSVLLAAQDVGVWTNSTVLQTYNVILSFITHSKPRIRHAAHRAIYRILKVDAMQPGADSKSCHPTAALTAKYCVELLEEHGVGELTTTLHLLNFLKSVMRTFPQQNLKTCCESVMGLMSANNVLLTTCCMQTLHGMFIGHQGTLDMSAKLNAQLISALYDFQPSPADSQLTLAWMTLMEAALKNLLKLNEEIFMDHWAKFVSVITQCWLSSKLDVCSSVTSCLKTLLYGSAPVLQEKINVMLSNASGNATTPIHRICQTLQSCLSFQYNSVWKQVLHVIAVLFEVLGRSCVTILKDCLKSLSHLRKSEKFPCINELEYALGMAVRSMGPKAVLDVIPLNVADESFENSWLIPILRNNVRETELKFFVTYFLPLDMRCHEKIKALENADERPLAKSYTVFHYQIWSLLPGFCNSPTDLKTSFKDIAKTLGVALTDSDEVRYEVQAALRKLVSKNLNHDENRKELARFAKNFLPILFNIYTTPSNECSASVRQSAFETIKVYLEITDTKVTNILFDKAVDKATTERGSLRNVIFDIIRLLLPNVSYDRIEKIFNMCTDFIQHSDRTIQKKAYRIFEELCTGKTEDFKKVLQYHLDSLKMLLMKLLTATSTGSKTLRLQCLDHILNQTSENDREFTVSLLPEVIVNLTGVPTKVSAAAVNLCITIGNKFLEWGEESQEELIKKYLKIVFAGFGGSTHMIRSTAVALGHIISSFKGKISAEMLSECVDNIVLLLSSKYREVVSGALDFIKMFIVALDHFRLNQNLGKLLEGLNKMPEGFKVPFKIKIRRIFERLIRKFGWDYIYKMAGKFQRLVTHIRKQEALSKKKKVQNSQEESDDYSHTVQEKGKGFELLDNLDEESDDDDDDDDNNVPAKSLSRKTQSSATCIYEDADKEIVDLLEPKSIQNIFSSSNAPEQPSSRAKNEFRTSNDGRLIIEERSKGGKSIPSRSGDELFEGLLTGVSDDDDAPKGTKRKFNSDRSDGASTYRRKSERTRKSSKKSEVSSFGNKRPAKSATGSQKLDPYAYIPLRAQALNRRKRSKFIGQFKGIVRGAVKGARKGQKIKNKRFKTSV